MIRLNVGGKLFTTRKETLVKSEYFAGLFENTTTEEEIFLDRDPKAFRCVLYYLRDDNYFIPKEYMCELDFYGLACPKYSQMREKDSVDIYATGEKFTVKAHSLMKQSKYFNEKLSILYVGTDLYLKGSAKGFSHFLRRIRDNTHYIPEKYIAELGKYEGPSIKWLPDTMVSYYVSGIKLRTRYEILSKIPYLKGFLESGHLSYLKLPVKAWYNIIGYLEGVSPALLKYKAFYEAAKVIPKEWFRENYLSCPSPGCNSLSKRTRNNRHLSIYSESQYCSVHGCCVCYEKAEKDTAYCKEHKK